MLLLTYTDQFFYDESLYPDKSINLRVYKYYLFLRERSLLLYHDKIIFLKRSSSVYRRFERD